MEIRKQFGNSTLEIVNLLGMTGAETLFHQLTNLNNWLQTKNLYYYEFGSHEFEKSIINDEISYMYQSKFYTQYEADVLINDIKTTLHNNYQLDIS